MKSSSVKTADVLERTGGEGGSFGRTK